MTPQERQLLESLMSRVTSAPAQQKDPEAEALIQQKLGTLPDALYILTQTVLIQEMALNQANTRLHELEQQINAHRGEPAPRPTSFLGRLFGAAAPSRPAQPQFAPPPGYEQAQYQPSPSPYAAVPSQGSSFLRSAAMTATGVAAGALAFEGIESLFGHHGGYGGNAFGGGEFLGGAPSETIVNNYYDEPSSGDRGGDQFASGDNASYQPDDSGVGVDDASFDSSLDSSNDDFSSTDV